MNNKTRFLSIIFLNFIVTSCSSIPGYEIKWDYVSWTNPFGVKRITYNDEQEVEGARRRPKDNAKYMGNSSRQEFINKQYIDSPYDLGSTNFITKNKKQELPHNPPSIDTAKIANNNTPKEVILEEKHTSSDNIVVDHVPVTAKNTTPAQTNDQNTVFSSVKNFFSGIIPTSNKTEEAKIENNTDQIATKVDTVQVSQKELKSIPTATTNKKDAYATPTSIQTAQKPLVIANSENINPSPKNDVSNTNTPSSSYPDIHSVPKVPEPMKEPEKTRKELKDLDQKEDKPTENKTSNNIIEPVEVATSSYTNQKASIPIIDNDLEVILEPVKLNDSSLTVIVNQSTELNSSKTLNKSRYQRNNLYSNMPRHHKN